MTLPWLMDSIWPDGSGTVTGQGRSPVFLSPSDAKRFGMPTVSVVTGGLTISFVPEGNLTSLSLHGHVLVDVCASLS